MENNPWQVESIQEFSFLKCPECIFDSKEEDIFQEHAVKNHPLSFVLFGKTYQDSEFTDLQGNIIRYLQNLVAIRAIRHNVG